MAETIRFTDMLLISYKNQVFKRLRYIADSACYALKTGIGDITNFSWPLIIPALLVSKNSIRNNLLQIDWPNQDFGTKIVVRMIL